MRGATILKASDDKTRSLNKHVLMAFSGESGDTGADRIEPARNAQLYSMRNETELSPSALAHFVRGELASSLRSRKPYNVNLLMGGVDPITGKPHLYWLDYLAALAEVPYAAHGYAQYYCLSILDKHHHPDIELDEGIKLLQLCTDELKRRLPVDFKGMIVKAIKADGIREIEFDDDRVTLIDASDRIFRLECVPVHWRRGLDEEGLVAPVAPKSGVYFEKKRTLAVGDASPSGVGDW
ncbi:proteasome A-type and B-type [Drechmeria coniospora]|uniref:Proteasome subunit beta n=1 Tax=Drechmeria coniospora TaxID=98403 RepID=A0A151GWK1_DRECN|nr:proteasome A-type and B-type [Drechmeria coniospora]KYK61478.1 proteasome A-type and B-type [Drechmeria coniospora]